MIRNEVMDKAIQCLNSAGLPGRLTVEGVDVILFGLYVESTPPSDGYKVTNLYIDSRGKLVVEYDTARKGG